MQVARKSRGKIDKPKPKKEASAYIFLIYLQRTKKVKTSIKIQPFQRKGEEIILNFRGEMTLDD